MSYYTPTQHDRCVEFYLANPDLSVAECIRRIQRTVPGLEKYTKSAFYRLLHRRGLIEIQKGNDKHVHIKPRLTPEEEMICVDFKKHRLLSTSECYEALRKLFPNLTKGNLRAVFRRHEVAAVTDIMPVDRTRFWNHGDASNVVNPIKKMLTSARNRARQRGLDFDLTFDDLEWTGICPVFGIPLVPGKGRSNFASPSLDRIDNSKGYVKGNVIIVSLRANTIKNSATPEELTTVAKFYTDLQQRDLAGGVA